jgi:tRNA modification GTPase
MFDDHKTIFALATPPGKSGVAIIRVSGADAFKCLDRLTTGSHPQLRYAALRTLVNPITKHMNSLDVRLITLLKLFFISIFELKFSLSFYYR